MILSRLRLFSGLLLVSALGCSSKQDQIETKPPRPVSVLRLLVTDPTRFDRYTGTVASWKTDQLGFEVAGRVEFVVEPETDIHGQSFDKEGGIAAGRTELARLDPARYEINVESAKTEIESAKRKREATQIELDSVIPAQIDAAEAQFLMAKTEVARYENLVPEGAASQRALEISNSRRDQAAAQLKQLAATREAKRAEVASIDAQIADLQESLRQAERDLADCRLFWSVPGQVAEVHVIAGSYVERGQPVVTVQMMQPIKVEFEVAASTARTVTHRDQVKIYIPQPDGTMLEQVAFIYMIDPIADPNTRTFTITLMLPNKRIRSSLPQPYEGQVIARTDSIGKLITGFGMAPHALFVSEEHLQQDEEGHFVWRILNRRVGRLSQQSDRVLRVRKVRVVPGQRRFPILGLTVLREVRVADGEQLDPAVDLITGQLVFPPGEKKNWSSDRVFYDVARWQLRPGDLVSVDLSGGEVNSGFYVPLDAILEKSGTKYVFVVEPADGGDTVRRVEVTLHDPVGTLRRIEAAAGQKLEEGMRVVASGGVFLVDGQRVNVAEEVEVRR